MRSCVKSILTITVVVLFVSAGSWAQEFHHYGDSPLFARFSFDSPKVQSDGIQRLCFAVSQDGNYRMVRFMGGQIRAAAGLHGKMSKEDRRKLKSLVESSDFLALSGWGGSGLIRSEAESFTADFPSADPASSDHQRTDRGRRVQWLNADGESPFPEAVAKVIQWMKDFKPKEAKSFDYAEFPDACGAAGLRLVQPTVATNQQP